MTQTLATRREYKTPAQAAAWYVEQARLAAIDAAKETGVQPVALALKSLAVFVLLISAAFAQQFVSSGGILTSRATVLTLPVATITAQVIGQTITTGNLGTFSMVTPTLATGTIAAGGTFEAGGAVSISVPGIPLTYLPAFVAGAVWQRNTLANGTHFYTLSADFLDSTGRMGAMVLSTSNVGTGNFVSPVTVASVSMVVDAPGSSSKPLACSKSDAPKWCDTGIPNDPESGN